MRNFLLHLAIFAIGIIFAQMAITRFVAPILPFTLGIPGISNLDKHLYLHDKILYFGDSVITSSASKDADKSSISKMLAKLNPSFSIGDISSPSYHLAVFEAMLNYISNSPDKPEAVIVPINLRSFSPTWDMAPGDQFDGIIFFLNHHFLSYFSKPLVILQAFKFKTMEDETFFKTSVYYGEKSVGIVRDFIDTEKTGASREEILKSKFIFYYMYNLDQRHRKMASLRNMIATARRAGVKLYVYITPIDFENGKKYVGSDFVKQLKLNTDLICSTLKEEDLSCLNLAFDLNASYFDYELYPNEHLNEQGREYVAQKLKEFFK